MRHAPDVAEVARDAPPLGTVTRARASESVRDLVQQGLVDGVVVEKFGQVPRHGDAFAPEVAQAGASRRTIEVEAP